MTTPAQFARLCTERWFSEDTLDSATGAEWLAQLQAAHQLSWVRLISAGWLGQPFEDLDRVRDAVEWIGSDATGVFFIAPRGRNSTTLGVQFWLSYEQDATLVNLMAYPVRNQRVFLPEQFADHIRFLVDWRRFPLVG